MSLAACALADAPPGDFLPPHATVVLLSGLPGDLESERMFHDQAQSWLAVLADAPAPVQDIFVFFEDPEAISPPADVPAQKLKASREEFLALGRRLAGKTNPLVVIAWGHGGMQGRAPVFHVRGPRLTPADFKAFAASMPQARSRWVLLFRGSGRLAAELSAPDREIISSENETLFTSDPIAMTPLLKIVRADGALSFQALGQQLGRAVAAWYAERNLARTEEPTLWVDDRKPQPLVPADSGEAVASEESKPQDTPERISDRTSASTNLSGVWKEITRVEPARYPDADAVVLRRRVSYTLGSSPAVAAEHEEFVQILTAEGKHRGDFDFAYSPPQETITFLDCEVLRADGTILRLDPDEIRESAEAGVGDYRAGRRKFFSLPGVAPGALLHLRYRTEWKKFPLPHVSLQIPLALDLPVVDQQVQVSVPKDSAFHFLFDDLRAPDPLIKQSTYGTSYTWRFEDLPPLARDALAPPGRQSALRISTFPDWRAFAQWYGRIIQFADEITPDISARAAELTRDARTDRDKARALYHYVAGLRYVAVPLGVNSHRPHAAANVLRNQFGDCKDKANLFNALLRSLDIDAHLVLVPRFSQAHESLPGFAFNHAISRVRLGEEILWIDTTDDICRFGLLPPGDPGRKVLVIDGETSSLTPLPQPEPKEHHLRLRARVECGADNPALPITLEVVASGHADYELRGAAREAKEHAAGLPLLAVKFRPAAGAFSLQAQRWTAVSALEEAFTWRAEGEAIGILALRAVGRSGPEALGEGKRGLRAPFWLPREWDLALHRRKSPLFLNQGYPLTLEEEFEFALPGRTERIILPSVCENNQGPLRWKVEWTRTDDPTLRAHLRVELARGELPLEEALALQRQLRELFAALAAEASFW